ncbi:MAG TPA: YihY/virulence factor BrkB family protein [Actinomycetota bacterium]|nr:YihY/virulence factor BrkB family protein [Actinomycetota bacterium]
MKLIARLLAVFLVFKRMKAKRGLPPDPPPPDRAATQPLASRRPAPSTDRPAAAAPDTPAELERADWKVTVKRTLKEVKDDRATLAAAGMAYYFFLAIFPAVIAVIGIMDLAGTSTESFVKTVRDTLPGGTGQVIVEAVQGRDPDQGRSLIAAITGVALALWSASSGMAALQSGLNVAYDIPEDRKFFGKRAVAFALLLAAGLLGGVPTPFIAGEGAVKIVGWVITVPAVIVLFAFFYYLGPKRESPKWVWVTPGGLVGAILWLVVSGAFGFYVREFATYGKTYGSLASVIVLIFWLYLSALTILVGGELNAEVERRAEQRGGSTRS